MMEQWGSGWQRIREACKDGGYPEPEWQEPGACTRVIFHPHPEMHRGAQPNDPVKNHDLNARQQWFVMQFDVGHKVNAADIVGKQIAVHDF